MTGDKSLPLQFLERNVAEFLETSKSINAVSVRTPLWAGESYQKYSGPSLAKAHLCGLNVVKSLSE
jgi:hypothetical protein